MDAMHTGAQDTKTTRRLSRGVTLIEAVLAIAVVALLAATAAPSLSAFVDARRLDAAAVELAADLQLARRETVSRRRGVEVSVLADGGNTCWLLHTGDAAGCRCGEAQQPVCTGDAVAIKGRVLTPADRLSVAANVATLGYDPLHGTVTPTGTLRVVDARRRAVHHVVNVMGRVRSCSPDGALPGWQAC